MNKPLKYRPDIDGLRALAVLAVVFFHVGSPVFSGGFVGVDVFFVISGYLITQLILTQLEANRFSLRAFWMRRVRRLFPALFLVMVATAVAFFFVFAPTYYRDFGRSLVAQSLFSSNFLFWWESGYFDTASEAKPLLHTWSLAVEEQFYLLYPGLLVLIHSFMKKHLLAILAAVSFASLALSIWLTDVYPTAAFFLLPARAWELGMGAFLAVVPRKYFTENRFLCNAISLLGIIAILVSIVVYDGEVPFPSFTALLPTLGTAAFIYANSERRTLLGAAFSWKPIAAIGLVSYSLYLWHWPVLVLNNSLSMDEPSVASISVAVLVSGILAVVSYVFVENPIHRRKDYFPNKPVVVGSALSAFLLIAYGSYLHFSDGFLSRIPAEWRDFATVSKYGSYKTESLDAFSGREIRAGKYTVLGDTTVPPSVAILGDSHASALTQAMTDKASELGKSIIVINGVWCAPFVDFGTDMPERGEHCRGRMNAAFDVLEAMPDLDAVILYAEWSNYTTGVHVGPGWLSGAPAAYYDAESEVIDPKLNGEVFLRAIQRSVEKLNARVIVILPTPENRFDVPELAIRFAMGLEVPTTTVEDYKDRNSLALDLFRQADHGELALEFIDPLPIFCDGDVCSYMVDRQALYTDSNHLSRLGAEMLLEPFIGRIFRTE